VKVRYAYTADIRPVGTPGGERFARDLAMGEADVTTIDELIALRHQYLSDTSFRWVDGLDEMVKRAAVRLGQPAHKPKGRHRKERPEETAAARRGLDWSWER
jgi:hypothetical protein